MITIYSKEDMKKYETFPNIYEFVENRGFADVNIVCDIVPDIKHIEEEFTESEDRLFIIKCKNIRFVNKCCIDFLVAENVYSNSKLSVDNILSVGDIVAEEVECTTIHCKNIYANTVVCDNIYCSGKIMVDDMTTRYIGDYEELNIDTLTICDSHLKNVYSCKNRELFVELTSEDE